MQSIKWNYKFNFAGFLILLCLTGCGYQFGAGEFANTYKTISVPLIEGDEDGSLTSAVIEQICKTGGYQFCPSGGAAILQVQIIDLRDENIGFRYDRKKDGKRRNEIIPTETRVFITAEVALVEYCSGKNLLGPVQITASVDFDHDYCSSHGEVNVFSLGQLSDYDVAAAAAQKPLNQILAEKIVDFINDSW